MTKTRDIKELGDKTFACKAASMSDLKVRMLGDNYACATLLVKMTGTYKGKDFRGDFRALDFFEKKGDKWQAVISQITKVEKDKESQAAVAAAAKIACVLEHVMHSMSSSSFVLGGQPDRGRGRGRERGRHGVRSLHPPQVGELMSNVPPGQALPTALTVHDTL